MMNIKSLSSGIAAAALISTIGLAYAQSATEPAPQAPATAQTVPSTPAPTEMSTTPAPADSSAAPMQGGDGATGASITTEREPRADRN